MTNTLLYFFVTCEVDIVCSPVSKGAGSSSSESMRRSVAVLIKETPLLGPTYVVILTRPLEKKFKKKKKKKKSSMAEFANYTTVRN